jgi:catechol 2,3-dioxygenase-like lactoylglutathione lyase family enzyme
MASPGALHHIELYVASLEESSRFWSGLLGILGYVRFQEWGQGLSYRLEDTYIVLVQVESKNLEPSYHRQRVGLNHLAFHAASRNQVDQITSWVRRSGYPVLYQDRHPFAGGPNYYALYCEDPNRIKVEIVAPSEN